MQSSCLLNFKSTKGSLLISVVSFDAIKTESLENDDSDVESPTSRKMDDCCPDGVSVLMHRARDITDNVGLVSKYFKHPRRERLGTVGQGLELFDSTNRLPTGFLVRSVRRR